MDGTAAAFRGDVQEEGSWGQGEGEGAQVPLQGRRDHAAAAMPRRPLLPHSTHARIIDASLLICSSFLLNSDATASWFIKFRLCHVVVVLARQV